MTRWVLWLAVHSGLLTRAQPHASIATPCAKVTPPQKRHVRRLSRGWKNGRARATEQQKQR
jgi:hypothetical protein